ncbi:DUF7547 family protein [Halosegnis marinus]|uniref:Uncharacterized protein n=1 Tax=Halosegnis marinus TaxID=3034023 RepID=A0ABD5ZSM1_9EURY|nr:hypothetical protein [Halosegnis sp. DT85]
MSDDSEDLAALVAELSETLDRLERRADADPPRRRAFLRFTEQYAIPTTVAMLEANIRVLEAVAGAIRVAEGRESEGRTARGRETALATLDRALSDVSDAVRGTPTDPEARELLGEARALRDEIRDRVDESRGGTATRSVSRAADADAGTTIPVSAEGESPSPVADPADEPSVDVDAELDTIKREVHGDDGEDDR